MDGCLVFDPFVFPSCKKHLNLQEIFKWFKWMKNMNVAQNERMNEVAEKISSYYVSGGDKSKIIWQGLDYDSSHGDIHCIESDRKKPFKTFE